MKVEIKEPVVMYCDNTNTINMSKNPVMHSKKKHIAIKYHFVRELVLEHSFLVKDWYLGQARNKIAHPNPQ